MMNRLGILLSSLILALVVVLFGRTITDQSETRDLRFAVTLYPTAGLAYAVESGGYFKQHALNVSLERVDEAQQAVELLTHHEVDGAILSLSEPLLRGTSGQDLVIVADADYSFGADGVVADKEITDIDELRRGLVGVSPSGLSKYLLAEALRPSRLKLSDVALVPAAEIEVVREFLSGKLEAAALEEPYLTYALGRPGSHLLYSSKQTPGLIPHVIVFRKAFIAEHPDRVNAFLSAWFELADYIDSHPNSRGKVLATIAMSRGVGLADIMQSYGGLRLLTFSDNAVAFTYGSDITSLYGSALRLAEFLVTEGEIAVVPSLDNIIDPTFIRQGLQPSP